jgi:hypothetical protein
MGRSPKYDAQEALCIYEEEGTYAAVARAFGCSQSSATQAVRRAQGVCLFCGDETVEGRSFCEKHLKVQRENSRKLYHRRKLNGICPNCGKKSNRDGTLCRECADKNTQHTMKSGNKARDQGLCFNCRSSPLSERSDWLCETCLDKTNRRTKARREELLDAGICIRCREAPSTDENKSYCQECREIVNEAKRLKNSNSEWAMNRRRAMKENGHRCQICGEKAKVGHHIDESGNTDNPNDAIDNIAVLCWPCHGRLTAALELLKLDNIEYILRLLAESPHNNLQDYLN